MIYHFLSNQQSKYYQVAIRQTLCNVFDAERHSLHGKNQFLDGHGRNNDVGRLDKLLSVKFAAYALNDIVFRFDSGYFAAETNSAAKIRKLSCSKVPKLTGTVFRV